MNISENNSLNTCSFNREFHMRNISQVIDKYNSIMVQLNVSIVRYTIAAQELVAEARGLFTGQGWRKADGTQASFDDISAFVIPIHMYLQKLNNSDSCNDSIKEDSGKF